MKKLTKVSVSYPRFSVKGQLLLVLVCLMAAWLGFWAYAALADVSVTNTATMRIDPADLQVAPGQSFSVNVVIDNVANLGGFQFDLDYNPSIVHVDVSLPHGGADPGPFPGSTGRSVYELGPNVNNTTGHMSYGLYTTGSAPGPSGSGTLATIYFEAQQQIGTSSLLIQHEQITDPVGNILNVTRQGGVVTVGEGPAPTPGSSVYLPIILNNY